MFCVNVKSKEFKEACNRLNIHPSSLEVIVFQYLNNIDPRSFPSDEYIMSKLEGKAMTDASESQILLWEKAYSTPKVFSDIASVGAFIKEASKYFSPESISIHRNNEGQYVASITKPENRDAYEKEIKRILDNAPRNKEGKLLAPNGKPTKLSERQYAQVRTKAFKKWFGDWTKITQNEDSTWNIPDDVSKVIDDETGEPKVVYHSSNAENINIFMPSLSKFGFGAGVFFSDSEEYSKFVTHTKFTYALFLDIKNPINTNNLEREKTANLFLLEEPHSIQDWVEKFGTEEGYIEYFNSIKQRDGIIGEDAEKPSRYRGTVEYVVRNPNQIKSATDNVGTFSTESDDIRFNIQTEEEIYNVLDYFVKTLKDKNGVSLIHKKYGKYFLTKSAFGGTISTSAADAFDKIQEHLNYALLRHNLPINLLEVSKGKASKMVSINEEALKDTISRNETLASLKESFKSKEEYKKVKSILEFLANKTGLKYEIISQEKAKELLKSKKIDNVNAFVQEDTCYFIEGRQLNVDIAAEEMLHPFVASIRQLNPDAFKSLLRDAQKSFPRLRLEIARDYKGRPIEEIQEELVTQALSRAFREDIKNTPEGHSVKELIKNFINRIVEIFQSFFGENNSEIITEYKTRVDEILEREEITAQDLQSTITINELAEIVNSGLELYSPNIEGTRMNASWARTSENSYEVSTAGDRKFSAMVAKFNPGTIIEGVDVGGMTIEQVYQSVIKKSRKGQPPAKSSKLYKAPVSSYTGNITPEENTIFVFGSNPEGRHGAGAAKIAREQFGAIYGQGEGLQGNSYALPTKDLRVKENRGLRSIPEETIINSIRTLYEVARQNPDKQFKIAYRNTDSASLNGYTGLEMIDMFIKAGAIPSNIIFSKEWVDTGKFEISSQELEDYSYKEGYLPLWQEWAKQNPQLIEELRENSAGKTLTDKFANTRVSQARALAEILNSTRKEESTTIESSSELETKTIDEQFMEDNQALISQIEDLGNIGLSSSEIKHLGEQLMWWISDHLTWLQNNPSKLEETYGIKDKDASLMSREELASLITPSQLMTKCVEAFTKRQFKSLSQKSKVRKIANNWRALMFLSAKTFADIEGFGIIDSAAGFNVLQRIQTLTEDYNNDNDIDSITETVGDIQEHWQVEFRTIDVMNAMTPEVRLALLQCYVLDKDSNPIISEYGIKERIKPRQAVNTILRITQGQITVKGIIRKLRDNRDQYPWFDQLIARLEDQSGANSNFKSAFFSTFCKPFVAYSVVRKNPSTGVYESVIVNEFPALREAMNTITTQYKMRQHPMLGDTLNMDTFNAVKDIYTSLKDVKFADVNKDELVNKLTYIYNALGYYISSDLVSNIITEGNYKTIVENLGYIINNLTEGYTNNNDTYDPFKFGRDNKNIITSTRAIIKIITDTLEDTALSSTFDNGKMYQSYVTPSYLTKLMQKFTILSEEEFNKFMQEEYGQYKGWFTDSGGEYRLSWLRALNSSPEMRSIFKHKVQLNFNKHNYMRNMTDAEYTLSVISEFFAESDKAISNYNVAWYRVPMMSNKPSSEFIRFIAHKGSFYKDTITDNMYDIFLQELSRIQTVRMRNKGEKDIDFIKNFDTNGAKFCFLDFFNEYLNGSQNTSTFGRILNKKLEGEELTEEEKSILISKSKEIIKEHMEAKVRGIIQEWKAQGIVAQCSKIKGINPANIESELENFIWNDTLASMNIIQMTVTDIAYYKDAEDLQKRFAQIHSPGVRGNNNARDFNNNKVTDGYHRTVYLEDFEGVISNVIENITIVFDRKIKEAEDAGRTTEAESLKALKESLVGEKGAYRKINVTDAQGYCCATSYRKKAFIFGKWNKAKEEVYNKLMQEDYTATDLEIAFQPLKPFVYSQISKSSGVTDAPMGKLKTPIQNKNSEYLLLLAGAILQNEDTGKPNLLRAINEVMEESAEKSPTMGIDTIQFASAVKSSLTGVININDATNVEEAKERIRKAIYPDYKGDWKSYTPKVDYDERTVHKIPVEDYCIQQEVPPHFRDHDQAHGSQTRVIIIADLADGNYIIREGKTTRTVKKEEFIKEYEKTIAANIEEDINALAEELHLVGSSPAERNIAISRILQREILSNPNRYGTDLLVACSVDSNGNFRIPLGDPVQAKRVEQLINSIIKNRISKQKLPGGPVVQVSNFGTSRQLNIVFNGKDGKPLRKRAKGESEASYKEYLQKNQAGIAYMECFAPAYTLDLFKNFMDENGNVDIEAIEATDPELLKMVGYRIPTEDKYSIAPLKIVGFLPKEAGDGIMLPYDITLINGSDFDIDKMYLMRKTLPIRAKKDEKFTHHLQNAVFNKLISKAKQEGNGYSTEKIEEEAWEKVNIFFDNKLTIEKKKEKLGEYYTILSKAYRKYRYETITPTRDRDIRNNKILDMTYEVMTHETTADKMLNPGGFDQQKKMGYAVEAFRNLYTEEMSESDVLKLWEELQSKSIDELKELSYKDKNLCFIDTHIQFYKQNAAAGTLIGVFAVHKVAHAILGNDGFRYNGIESPFTIAGNTISGGISIDPERDFTGQYIGKVLGSLVASAADAVKDPILNLMNINNNTATVLCTMVRLGIPFDTAAMFLSQKSISEILQKHAKESLDSPTSLNEVIKKELKEIGSENTITANSEINTSELTKDELVVGLVTDNKAVKYKVLNMLSSLLDISKDVKSLSYPTRFNSISNAVGPLIIDNLMMEYKLKKFPENITSRDGNKITLEDFLVIHPMLKQFHRTVKIASHIFHDMPANSLNFRDLLSNLPKNLKSRITSDRKLLSMLSDFYQSYMLISSEAIDSSKLMWYIDKYPAEFIKLLKEDESLKSNPLCAAIRLDVAKQSGRPILKIDTTGVDSDYKESLMSGWADLVKTHPNVAKDLFIYNFFRGGIVFNPQTFMGLVPYQVKENIEGYNESYSNPARIEPYIVIDQFIRNYSSNNQIVPTVKSLEGLNKLDKPVKIGDTITIENSKDLESIGESIYFKVKSGNSYILFKVTSSSKYSKIITRMAPLGNNGEYLELSTDEIKNSAEITSLTDSTEESDNGIGVINGSDTEVEETITINDVTYTDETFTQFWSGKSETESKVFTKKLKGQSSAYLSRIVSILESKGIKVTEEMQNKIKELYNLTC